MNRPALAPLLSAGLISGCAPLGLHSNSSAYMSNAPANDGATVEASRRLLAKQERALKQMAIEQSNIAALQERLSVRRAEIDREVEAEVLAERKAMAPLPPIRWSPWST